MDAVARHQLWDIDEWERAAKRRAREGFICRHRWDLPTDIDWACRQDYDAIAATAREYREKVSRAYNERSVPRWWIPYHGEPSPINYCHIPIRIEKSILDAVARGKRAAWDDHDFHAELHRKWVEPILRLNAADRARKKERNARWYRRVVFGAGLLGFVTDGGLLAYLLVHSL